MSPGDAQRPAGSEGLAYALGAFTTVVVMLLVVGFVALRIGPGELAARVGETLAEATQSYTRRVLDLPDDVRDELIGIGGVIGNAGNPTGAREHDTIVVAPDEEHGFVLRPSRSILGFDLRPRNPWNLDPPILYVLEDAQRSPRLLGYLEDQARVRFAYTIDDAGFRVTLPLVDAPDEILAIGDSVMFGVGVDDEYTMASQLQQQLGGAVRVVNAGVGSYTGPQAIARARALSQGRRLAGLVYYTSQNDFFQGGGEGDPVGFVDGLLGELATMREQAGGRVVVMFVAWIQYCARDLLGAGKREDRRLAATPGVYAALPELARKHGVAYVDWNELCEAQTRETGSIFARMGLYVNHGHPSRLGHRLAAAKLAEALVR